MGGGRQKKEEEQEEIVENGDIPPAEKDGQQQLDHHHHDQFDIEFVIRSLEAALANEKHTQLGPYINAFAELKKLFSHLGVVFSFVETDLTNKHGILKDLSAKDQQNYATIERMVYYECFNGYHALSADGKNDQTGTGDATENGTTTKIEENGTLNNNRADTDKPMVATTPKAAGSRTLLRLHRALAFLMRLVEVVQRPSTEPTSNLFRKVYAETLSKHHTWYIRASVQCASAMVPNRAQLVQHIFGVNDKTGDEPDAAELSQEQERIDQIAQRFLQVTKQAYDRVQEFYERHGILELP